MVDVLDEVASAVRLDRLWSDVRSRLLTDEAVGEGLRILLQAGASLERWSSQYGQGGTVRGVLEALESNWDLVEDHYGDAAGLPALPPLDIARLEQALAGLVERRDTECRKPEDKLATFITSLEPMLGELRSAEGRTDVVRLLGRWKKSRAKVGAKGSWSDVEAARAHLDEVLAIAAEIRLAIVDAALGQLVSYLSREVLAAARQRQRDGRLLHHDLLVLARRLVRSDPEARVDLQAQYQRLLLDEFQDTDPIQVELAVRIAAGAAGGADDWHDCPVPAGSLFVVGDPKQAIYRFRRADIVTFLDAFEHLGAGGTTCSLTSNFRSTPEVLDWVNVTFGSLLQPRPGVQPEYGSLTTGLAPEKQEEELTPSVGPPVVVLGTEESGSTPGGRDTGVNEREARDVAAVIVRALHEGWTTDRKVDSRWVRRPLQPSDIAVLLPARTRLGDLEPALRDAGVPYRVEATSLLYRSDEVRDLLLVARAVDDPTDELVLVEALRTPVLGCGDDDLWRWKAAGGRWRPLRPGPGGGPARRPRS